MRERENGVQREIYGGGHVCPSGSRPELCRAE
jgi:hypothetical protein